jgi:hypothetical protein
MIMCMPENIKDFFIRCYCWGNVIYDFDISRSNMIRELIICLLVYLTIILLPLDGKGSQVAAAISNMSSDSTTAIISKAKIPTINNSLVVAQSPFYESKVWKLIGQAVSNSAAPQVQVSIVENGTMKGVGNVTNLETWWDTYKTPTIINALGRGILTTKDGQMATWTAQDVGRINLNTGITTYNGIMFFNTASTGSLAFLNNLAGLHITQTDSSMRTTNIWEWK